MKRYTVTSLVLALVALISFLYPGQFSESGGAVGQKRRSRRVAQPQAARKAAVYSRFMHSTKKHQEACNTCHKVPTDNWKKVSDFPDVADYPGHDACVGCHRPQFFKGAKPDICSICHSKVSPREDGRFAFRNPAAQREFLIEFPHDKHQDVIATLRARPRFNQIVRPSFVKSAHAFDEKTKKFNNCEICHLPNTKTPIAPPDGWTDGVVPRADSFKTTPTSHASCFNCHWQGQEPTKDDCASCHKLAKTPYLPSMAPKRKSMNFRHEGGGERKEHVVECTTCHINITKAATLQGLKPDVPITACTECHKESKSSTYKNIVTIQMEMEEFKKTGNCKYCHTSDFGKQKPPASHYSAAQ